MPTQQLLDIAERFSGFEQAMIALGYRPVRKGEFQKDKKRLGLVTARPRKGREVGFQFYANGLTARIWTTVLEEDRMPRDIGEDAGWVLITERDKARYFAHPLNRRGDFLGRLYKRAQIAQLRVLSRPLCPMCNAAMRITTGSRLKSRYWGCWETDRHSTGKPKWCGWDEGLQSYPKALAFVKQERKGRKPNQGAAMRKRRSWKTTHPENRL